MATSPDTPVWQAGFVWLSTNATDPSEADIRAALAADPVPGLSLVEQVGGSVWLVTLSDADAAELEDIGHIEIPVGPLLCSLEMP